MTKRKPELELLKDGTVLDRPEIDRIVAEVDEAVKAGEIDVVFPMRAGRPSLTGESRHSPKVAFRLTPELRAKAERVAAERGTSVSALARQALEEFLAS